jgi:hypothetical protein
LTAIGSSEHDSIRAPSHLFLLSQLNKHLESTITNQVWGTLGVAERRRTFLEGTHTDARGNTMGASGLSGSWVRSVGKQDRDASLQYRKRGEAGGAVALATMQWAGRRVAEAGAPRATEAKRPRPRSGMMRRAAALLPAAAGHVRPVRHSRRCRRRY